MPPVVIVGGGVIGTLAAYYLAKSGRRVTILERAAFGAACSHGNCGYVCPSHVLPLAVPGALTSTLKTLFTRNSPLKVRPWEVLKNLRWFLGFARKCNDRDMLSAATGIQALLTSSRRLYDDLLAAEKLDCEWDDTGLMFVFQTAKAFEHYAHVDDLLRIRFDTPAKRFDAAQLLGAEPALKPGSVSGGYLYEGDAQLRPDVLLRELRAKLNVSIVENCEVTGLRVEAGKAVAVRTTQGEVAAAAVVFAAGAWTPQLNRELGCKLPIIPGKGYSLTMPRPAVCPKFPMIFEEHRVAVSPFRTGYRIGSTMEFAGYDASMNPKRLKLLTDGAAAYLREPECLPVQEQWWGWRPMVYDGKPIIDRAPVAPNVLIAAGHGMLGLSMATGTGLLVAQILNAEKPHIDPQPYALARFG